jgi:hypothetical protein
MIKIEKLKILDNLKIHFFFSDNIEKIIDFKQYIGTDPLTSPLSDSDYFAKVRIYENGRGIYWPNGYDFCPDFLRYYQESDESELVEQKEYNSVPL